MVFEAGAVGLRMMPFQRDLSSGEQIDIIESLTSFWWLLELLPLRRLTFTRKEGGKSTTRKYIHYKCLAMTALLTSSFI
jgi:hypothetical protein